MDFRKLIEEHRLTTINLSPKPAISYPDNLKQMTVQHVRAVFEKCGKNVSKAAQALGIARNTVVSYLGSKDSDSMANRFERGRS